MKIRVIPIKFPCWLVSLLLAGGIFSTSLFAQSEEENASEPPTIIQPWLGSISGTVINEDGQPVVNAHVHWWGRRPLDRSVPYWHETKTDADGQFAFPDDTSINSAGFTLQISHPDYAVLTTYSVDHPSSLEFTMVKGRSIKGRIVDKDKKGVSGVHITTFPQWTSIPDRLKQWTTATDENGEFEIKHGTAGDHCSLKAIKKGVISQQFSWYANKDDIPPQYANLPKNTYLVGGGRFVHGDFTYELPGRHDVTLNAVNAENGNPVKLKRVGYKHLLQSGSPVEPRIFRFLSEGDLESSESSPTFTDIEYGTYHFYALPEAEAGVLGGFFRDQFGKETKTVIHEFKLEPGILLEGSILDATNGEPIPRVSIQYYPDDQIAFDKLGIVPQLDVKTNEEGKFRIRVPDHPGEIRMVSAVSGYVTITSRSELNEDVRTAFAYRVPQGIRSEADIQLTLQPSPRILVEAVDSNGNPLPNVCWMSLNFRHRTGRQECGRVGDDGSFVIRQFFDDAIYDYDQEDKVYNPGTASEFVRERRNRLYLWDPENFLCGFAKLTPSDVAEGKPLVIELLQGAAAKGRIINRNTKNPIPGVTLTVTAGRDFGSQGLRWTTRTNDDGEFLVKGLLPDQQFQLQSNQDYRLTRTPFQVGAAASLLDVGDLEAQSMTEIEIAFRAPDVSGMSDKEALERLKKFVKNQYEKAPERRKASGWSSGEARDRYISRLAKSMDAAVKELTARQPDSDFECEVYFTMLETFSADSFGPLPQVKWTMDARDYMIDNIDREGVFPLYRRLQWRTSGAMYESRIYENTKKKNIKAWALLSLQSDHTSTLMWACRSNTTEESFESQLKRLEEYWNEAINELGNQTIGGPMGQTVRERVLKQIERTMVRVQEEDDARDPDRVKKVVDLCKKLDPKNKH